MRSVSSSGIGVGLWVALILAAATAGPAPAAEEPTWGYAIAHELMSPFCPGRTLAACPSPQADELRQWILLQEASGTTREEVEAILYERYGPIIQSSPEPEGWGLAAWLLPVVVVVVGAGLVYLVLRRIVTPGGEGADPISQTSAALASDDPDLERRVEEEMQAHDA